MGKGKKRQRSEEEPSKETNVEGDAPNESPEKEVQEEPKPKVNKYNDDGQDTIFIRNLSFDTEEESLKEFIEENFGPTVYCLVCKDKETDESKGTAFAKFKSADDAAKCLREFKDKDLMTKFHLDGRNLIVLPAISRDKIKDVNHKMEKNKDKRNLALSKEGFIHHLSEEAKTISKSDMEKRKALDSRKRELLKNLHNFVGDTRLCIHNLPPSMDDARLRKIFHDHVKEEHSDAKILECRVMRNKKGSGKLGTSKGFGFVAFSKHEHALAALRALNNNPKVFTNDKRPIVEFSIENLVALNKKKTRLVNSQRKNKALQEAPSKKKKEDASSSKVAKVKKSFSEKKSKVKKSKVKGKIVQKLKVKSQK